MELVNETLDRVSWIVVERQGSQYPGAVARLLPPENELAWAKALATLGPQIMLRPVASETHADHYPTLLAAAAGCRLIIDSRLDLPTSFGALRLPSRKQDWAAALQNAISDLPETLRQGARTRAAALALPTLEAELPAWACRRNPPRRLWRAPLNETPAPACPRPPAGRLLGNTLPGGHEAG